MCSVMQETQTCSCCLSDMLSKRMVNLRHANCFLWPWLSSKSVVSGKYLFLTSLTNLPKLSSLQHGRPRWTYTHPSLQSLSPDQETDSWWLCEPVFAFLLSRLSPADFSKKDTGLNKNLKSQIKSRNGPEREQTSIETSPSLFLKSWSSSSCFFCSSVSTSDSCGHWETSETSYECHNNQIFSVYF